jgi:PBP1b-binding outer membrane lipoprotein LpoB
MKRTLAVLVLAFGLAGCAGSNPVNAPLPPGAINHFDATTFDVLSQAQATINSVKSTYTTLPASQQPQVKVVLNQAIADYNVAENAYKAYHAGGTQDTTALTAAIAALVADIGSLVAKAGGA